jgi:hypothetical protein
LFVESEPESFESITAICHIVCGILKMHKLQNYVKRARTEREDGKLEGV